MKIEIDFTDLTDVIYALYDYELNGEDKLPEDELTTREDVLVAIEHANRYLAEFESGKISLVEGN